MYAMSTAGYMVNRHYVPTLLANFREGAAALAKSGGVEPAIDVHWTELQQIHDWYVYEPRIGHQLPGFSDVERRFCNYGGI
jgi:hypothetical protein